MPTLTIISFHSVPNCNECPAPTRALCVSKEMAKTLEGKDCVFGVRAIQDRATGEHFVSVYVDCCKALPTDVPHSIKGTRVSLCPIDLRAR